MTTTWRINRFSPRVWWAIIVLTTCTLTGLIATWPVALHFTTAIPLGTEDVATVPIFNLWTLWWTANRVTHRFQHYWDAPIFYPHTGTFTYSEPQSLTGLIATPLWSLNAPPALIYNTALIILLTLNGVFAYRLTRALGMHPLAALFSGMLMVTLPFVAKVYGVLHNTALFGMLWTLDGLIRFGRNGSTRWAVWSGVGFITTFFTFQQHALFFAPFAGAAGLVALAQQHFRRRVVIQLVTAELATGIVILVVMLPVLTLHQNVGFSRTEEEVQKLSAQPTDFLTRPATAMVTLPSALSTDTGGLFPGILLLVLSLEGAITGVRAFGQRRWVWYLAGSALVALLLSLGLNLNLAGWRPFVALREIVPGLAEVRSVFRFAAITQLCLVLLAAIAFDHAIRLSSSHWRVVITAFIALLAAAENLTVPVPLNAVPLSPQLAWTEWLRAQAPSTVIVHVPFPRGGAIEDLEVEAWRMFAQMDHQKPMVNGYSGYFPRARSADGKTVILTYKAFQLAMAKEFPKYELLCVLNQSLGANIVVVDQTWLSRHKTEMEAYTAFLQPAYTDQFVQIYHLKAPAGACQSR